MKKIIISGADMGNKGAQAMLFIAASEVKKNYPSAEIYFTTSARYTKNLEKYKLKYLYKYTFINAMAIQSGQRNCLVAFFFAIGNAIKSIIKRNFTQIFGEYKYIKLIKEIDLIIDVSGLNLTSQFPFRVNRNYLDIIDYAHANDIQIVLMPQSFGPFDYGKKQAYMDERIKEALAKAKIIYAREEEGKRLLVEKYGLENVKLSDDLVLQNKKIAWNDICEDIDDFKIVSYPIQENSIAIIPNLRSFERINDGNMLELYKVIIKAILELGKNVYIIRHSNEDEKICRAIYNLFKGNKQVFLISGELNFYEYEEIICKFDFIIASRFHSIVHAYKNGVPCIGLGWAQKYMDLFKKCGQSQYVFDVREKLDYDKIIVKIKDMCRNCDGNRNIIIEHMKDIQKNNCFENMFYLINQER